MLYVNYIQLKISIIIQNDYKNKKNVTNKYGGQKGQEHRQVTTGSDKEGQEEEHVEIDNQVELRILN